MKNPFAKKLKTVKTTSFFEMKSSEKKRIIKKAAEESTKEQVKLLKKHGFNFNISK